MRRLALLLALLGLAAFGLLYGLHLGTLPVDAPAPPALPAPGGPIPQVLATDPAAPAATDPARRLEVPHEPETPPEPSVADGWLVLVVDRTTQAPVPAATVFFLDPDRTGDPGGLVWRLISGRDDLLKLLEQHGRKSVTGPDGETRIPVPCSRLFRWLAGKKDDRQAVRLLFPGELPPLRLELASEPVLRVQVVDARGAPAPGIPVGLVTKSRGERHISCPIPARDPDGIAEFRYLSYVLGTKRTAWPDASFAVCLAIPLAEPVEAVLDLDRIPESPIRLVLPETGRVEVRVLGPRPEGALFVGLMASGGSNEPGERAATRGAQPLGEGSALFPGVGLGLVLEAFVFRIGGTVPTRVERLATQAGPSPIRPGGTALLEVTLPRPGPIVCGLALDEEGRPLADREVRWTLREAEQGGQGTSLQDGFTRTDANGRIRILVRAEADGILELHLATTGEEERTGKASLAGPLPPGETEVGPIRLALPPLLAGGRVVDHQGRPIVGATVSLAQEVPSQVPGRASSWRPAWNPRTTTGETGTFALRGRLDATRIRVKASRPGYIQIAEMETPPGTGNLEVRLEAAGAVEGSLLFPEGFPKWLIHVRLVGPGHTEAIQGVAWRLDGCFEWLAVPPGTVRFELYESSTQAPLLAIVGILVRAGETTRDPRMQGIEVAQCCRALQIDLVDALGSPITPHTFTTVLFGPDYPRTGSRSLRRAPAWIFYKSLPLDLLIHSPGYRPVWLEGVDGDRLVTLERPLPVRLVLDGGLQTLPPGLELRAHMQLVQEEISRLPARVRPYFSVSSPAALDARGEARLGLPRPGTYRILLMLNDPVRRVSLAVEPGPPEPVRVLDQEAEQLFRIRIAQKNLADTITRVQAAPPGPEARGRG